MRSSVRMFATAAFTVLLMPTFSLPAHGAAKPATGVKDSHAGDDSAAATSGTAATATGPAVAPAAPAPSLFAAPITSASMAEMEDSRGRHGYTPRAEWFLGYSYLRSVPRVEAGNRLVWLNGGSTSIAFNLNRYLGIVGDFGGFNDTQLRLGGTGGNPTTVADSDGTVFTLLGGPRLSLRKYGRITPFVQALFGGARASEVTLSGCTSATCTLLPTETAFALTAGGGLDINVSRHFAIRLFQAEYLMTRFKSITSGTSTMENDVRASSGIVFRFGGAPPRPPLPPVSYSCSVSPPAGFLGDRLAVSGVALNLNPTRTAVYTWTADGGTVTAGAPGAASIDTTNVPAGSYTLKGHVAESDKPGGNADCTASYSVKAFEVPTVSCSANPSSVTIGDSPVITASGISPQNRPLTYSYSSTSGSVSGTGSTATLSTVGTTAGTVTVSCNVADDKGQSASATTPVTVQAPAAAPQPVTSELCSIHFERDVHRPSRVDNEAKACLDDIALSLQRSSDAKLAIIGNASNGEKGGNKLASERAVNTKAYLVGEKGIDASRIAVYTGSQDGKTASTTLIPSGATLDTTGDTHVEESTVKAHHSIHASSHPQ